MFDDVVRFEGGGDTLDNVLDLTRGLDACQMRRATEVMKALTIHELRGPDGEPGSCPPSSGPTTADAPPTGPSG